MPWKYEHIGKDVKINVEGLRRRWSSSWSNSASEHARDLILVSNPRFLGMANHLGPFSGASDQPEGQELGGGAVGGQEGLQDVKFYLW